MEEELLEKHQYTVGGKSIQVYPSPTADRPIVYLNTFKEEGDRVYKALCSQCRLDFTLVAISGLDWDHDMAPWDIPPISSGDTPCIGGADAYFQLLTGEIMPKAEEHIQGDILRRGLAGYSLAGLFAVYSMYRTERFRRVASMSGSLWFPGFKDYVFSHEMIQKPEHLYLSLGDRECRTGNPYLKVVQEYTEEIDRFYQINGIDTVFQLNSGDHFKNTTERTAAGIKWILDK